MAFNFGLNQYESKKLYDDDRGWGEPERDSEHKGWTITDSSGTVIYESRRNDFDETSIVAAYERGIKQGEQNILKTLGSR